MCNELINELFELYRLKRDILSFHFMLLHYQALGKEVVLNFCRITDIGEKLNKPRHSFSRRKMSMCMFIQRVGRQVKRPPKRDNGAVSLLFGVKIAGSLKLLLILDLTEHCCSVPRNSLNHSCGQNPPFGWMRGHGL